MPISEKDSEDWDQTIFKLPEAKQNRDHKANPYIR